LKLIVSTRDHSLYPREKLVILNNHFLMLDNMMIGTLIEEGGALFDV
jgi:hypothetical protein